MFWSYQLNSTANSAHLPEIWPSFEVNGLDWQCYLAGSSKTAPRILIFSIAIGADYSNEMKNSEIQAPEFFKHNISFIATVLCGVVQGAILKGVSSQLCLQTQNLEAVLKQCKKTQNFMIALCNLNCISCFSNPLVELAILMCNSMFKNRPSKMSF